MATAREYQLTMEAILTLVNKMPIRLHAYGDAHRAWQVEGCEGLAVWAVFIAATVDVSPEEEADLESLYDLCIALNLMIAEDTSV